MNIMLVSVIELTREIGLRKSVGVRKRDILTQFLIESLIIGVAGDPLGILSGGLISWLIGKIASASGTSLSPVVVWVRPGWRQSTQSRSGWYSGCIPPIGLPTSSRWKRSEANKYPSSTLSMTKCPNQVINRALCH